MTTIADSQTSPTSAKSSADCLVELLVGDVLAMVSRGQRVPANLDRAFAVNKLPATLKALVRDKTLPYVPAKLLVDSLFSPALENCNAWKMALDIRTQIIPSNSGRRINDDDKLPVRLDQAKSMMSPWALDMANCLIGDLSGSSSTGLPKEMLEFLVNLDHALQLALIKSGSGLTFQEINQHRFAMLNRVLAESYLLQAERKIQSLPQTDLQYWLHESFRDSLQKVLEKSATSFFEMSFASAPAELRKSITQLVISEMRSEEAAKKEAKKKLVLERTASLKRRAPRGHTRSNSDSVEKFEDIRKQKIREAKGKQILKDLMEKFDLRGLPETLLATISKGYQASIPADKLPSQKHMLNFLNDSLGSFLKSATLAANELANVKRLKNEIEQKLDKETEVKAVRRATEVTISRDFLDKLFAGQQAGPQFEEAEEVILPDTWSVSSTSSTSGPSGTSSISSTSGATSDSPKNS